MTFDKMCPQGRACYPANKCPEFNQGHTAMAYCNEDTRKVCCLRSEIPKNTANSIKLTPIGGYLPQIGTEFRSFFSSEITCFCKNRL